MPTLMDYYNTGLAARTAQTQNKYLDPMLAAQLYEAQTKNKYLDPQQAAATSIAQTQAKYLPSQNELANNYQTLVNKYYAPEKEADIGEKNFYMRHPLLKLGGGAGQIGAALFLQEQQNRNSGSNQPLKVPTGNEQNTPQGAQALPQNMQDLLPSNNYTPMPNYIPAVQQTSGLGAPVVNVPPPPVMTTPPANNAPSNQGLAQNPNGAINPMTAANSILNNLTSVNNARNAKAGLDTARLNNYQWAQLPAEVKNNVIAQGAGMGIDPVTMQKKVASGMTIPQIAKEEGLDPDNLPQPIYAPTTATKTRVQQVQQVSSELDYLSSAATALVKPFADTYFGKSPQRIMDMWSNDPAKQKEYGRYLAGLALQTGVQGGRFQLEGGKPGVTILMNMKKAALAGIDQSNPIFMSKVAYQEMNDTLDKVIQKGAKIRTLTGMAPYGGAQQNTNAPAKPDITQVSTEDLWKMKKMHKGGASNG